MKPIYYSFQTVLFMLTFVTSGFAQVNIHFDKFQEFSENSNLDSAFYHAHALANRNEAVLNQLTHQVFAQKFRKLTQNTDTAFAVRLLRKMYADSTSLPLRRALYPLYWYVEIANQLADPAKVRPFVTGFMKAQAKMPEETGNRIDRYALLIYNQLKKNSVYSALADTLFNRTVSRLEHAVNGTYFQAVEDRNRRDSRAYFRYLLAYANDLRAREASTRGDLIKTELYRKQASDFSPDEHDRQSGSAYFYESVMLFGEQHETDFQQAYADLLVANGDSTSALTLLTDITLADPGRIDMLKSFYSKVAKSGHSFSDYWTKSLNAKLKPAEAFSLVSFDNQTFDYDKLKGKWILIDFWGTWCAPCVAELPEFQKFYTEVIDSERQDLVIFTVDCNDASPEAVKKFLQKNRYTFPVITGTDTLIKQFRVGEYPTKVLITPQGNRMRLPSGTNWIDRVKIYTAN